MAASAAASELTLEDWARLMPLPAPAPLAPLLLSPAYHLGGYGAQRPAYAFTELAQLLLDDIVMPDAELAGLGLLAAM